IINGKVNSDYTERELLYKVLFDMKKDMHELKQFVLHMAEANQLKTEPAGSHLNESAQGNIFGEQFTPIFNQQQNQNNNQPIIIDQPQTYVHVEENLSLIDKERELIHKALKKHRGKRKDAALELGISERTLYRKIKEYQIEENYKG
ncbi:MAG: helix-turn-helix domain-containing protein, partial [Fimbriimonadaceae bacterium]|nr:helix-turn-helix domain-containing protein [Chitinophagales bacterium]